MPFIALVISTSRCEAILHIYIHVYNKASYRNIHVYLKWVLSMASDVKCSLPVTRVLIHSLSPPSLSLYIYIYILYIYIQRGNTMIESQMSNHRYCTGCEAPREDYMVWTKWVCFAACFIFKVTHCLAHENLFDHMRFPKRFIKLCKEAVHADTSNKIM